MSPPLRRSLLLAIPLVVMAAAMAFTAPLGADYPGPPCSVCDFAGPPIAALGHGDLGGFFSVQPVMGSFSLLLRTPFAAGARLAGGGELLQYQLGAFACLLGVVLFALALERLMARRGSPLVVRLLVMGLTLANPLVFASLKWGHPEEPLAAVLAAGGVLLALRGRSLAAGLALGLALATKQWAWLAILPAMIVVPGRVRFLATAAGTFGLFAVPMLIGDAGRFVAQIHHYGMPGNGVTPANVWWVYGHKVSVAAGAPRGSASYSIPDWLGHVSHPLVIVVALALTVAYWRGRRERDPADVLALVALVFLVRAMLDPLTYSYHHLPFMVALVSFEAMRRRVPVASMLVTASVLVMTQIVAPLQDPNLLNRTYLAWAIPAAGYLAFTLFARRERSTARSARRYLQPSLPTGPQRTESPSSAT
jgi:hypothetical protein